VLISWNKRFLKIKNTTYLYTTPKTNLSSKIELEYKVKIVHYCYIEYNSKIVHNGKMYKGKLYRVKIVQWKNGTQSKNCTQGNNFTKVKDTYRTRSV
jgi:hypothetical protein